VIDPTSKILLMTGSESQPGLETEEDKEAQQLLDEAEVNYNITPGCDFRGSPTPWLFLENGAILYGIRAIREFANRVWEQKARDEAMRFLGPTEAEAWFDREVPVFDGKTPKQVIAEGKAKEVFGIILAVEEGVHL
jgi:hypothetical protein